MKKLFKIDAERLLISDLPEITRNEKVLLFYDFPLVYVGENNYGNIILGYWVGYDEELDIERHYHVIITSDIYDKYVRREISLLDIFQSHPIFVMDYKPDGSYIVYQVPIEDIPEPFLPTKDSYYPGEEVKSDKFVAKIDSPTNSLDVDSMIDLIQGVKNTAQNAAKILYPKQQIGTYVSGVQAGSFVIEYFIQTTPTPGGESLFQSLSTRDTTKILSDALAEYFQLLAKESVVASFPYISQTDQWIDFIKSNRKLPFLHYLESLIDSSSHPEDVIKRFLSNFERSIESVKELSETIPSDRKLKIHRGDPFTAPLIEIKQSLTSKFDEIYRDILTKVGKIIFEEEGSYDILIYHLNILTRVGNAYVPNKFNEKKMDRPRIRILGDFDLTQTEFTQSLHENVWITVKGKATIEGDRIKYIEIYS